MINKIIAEIRKALANEMYIIALNSALTLPDICAKAEYPHEKNNNTRYKNWVKHYIETREFGVYWESCFKGIDAELIYDLRCSLLHQGNPNVKKKIANYFELITTPPGDRHIVPYTIELEYQIVDGEKRLVAKRVGVNVAVFCNLLCAATEEYYNFNKEKFGFFNYNLVNMDFHTAQTFKISDAYRNVK